MHIVFHGYNIVHGKCRTSYDDKLKHGSSLPYLNFDFNKKTVYSISDITYSTKLYTKYVMGNEKFISLLRGYNKVFIFRKFIDFFLKSTSKTSSFRLGTIYAFLIQLGVFNK